MGISFLGRQDAPWFSCFDNQIWFGWLFLLEAQVAILHKMDLNLVSFQSKIRSKRISWYEFWGIHKEPDEPLCRTIDQHHLCTDRNKWSNLRWFPRGRDCLSHRYGWVFFALLLYILSRHFLRICINLSKNWLWVKKVWLIWTYDKIIVLSLLV